MKRKKQTRLIALAMCLVSAVCSALIMEGSSGSWPDSWPKNLEPFRSQAHTFWVANGTQETVYEIPFTNRDEFEKLWPVLLTIKSKNAPITLYESPHTNFVAGSTVPTSVCIIAPPDRHSPFPSNAVSQEIPEYITNGFRVRARTDLVLVTDGHVIDITRIKLPEGTPIIDHRQKK
jgi:hypothetical protein